MSLVGGSVSIGLAGSVSARSLLADDRSDDGPLVTPLVRSESAEAIGIDDDDEQEAAEIRAASRRPVTASRRPRPASARHTRPSVPRNSDAADDGLATCAVDSASVGLRPEDLDLIHTGESPAAAPRQLPPSPAHAIPSARPIADEQEHEEDPHTHDSDELTTGAHEHAFSSADAEPPAHHPGSDAPALPIDVPVQPLSSRPSSAVPASSASPFDLRSQLEAVFAETASDEEDIAQEAAATPASAAAAAASARARAKHARATSASRRAWSVQSKIVRPPGVPSHAGIAAAAAAASALSRPSTATVRGFAASSSSSPPRRPMSAAPRSVARPLSGARPFPAHTPGAPPASVDLRSPLVARGGGLYPGAPVDRIARIYSRAVHVSETAFEHNEAAASTAPPFRPPPDLDLRGSGGPASADDRHQPTPSPSAPSPVRLRADSQQDHDSADAYEASFAPAESASSPTAAAANVASTPTRRLVRDILTGEDREVLVRDEVYEEDDEDEEDARFSAAATIADAPPASIIVTGGGGLFSHVRDTAPVVVSASLRDGGEDTFGDRDTFKSHRLRLAQAEALVAAHRARAGTGVNPGNLPGWKSYADYSVGELAQGRLPESMARQREADARAAARALDAALGRPTSAPAPTKRLVARPRESGTFYASDFVPARLVAATRAIQEDEDIEVANEDPILAGPVAARAPRKNIGDFGAVRPLRALAADAARTAKRTRAETTQEERKRALDFARHSTRTLRQRGSPIAVAEDCIPPPPGEEAAEAEAREKALRQEAVEHRRRVLGSHYQTNAFRAAVEARAPPPRPPPPRPLSAGSAYSQSNLRAASPVPPRPFSGRSVGAANTVVSRKRGIQTRAALRHAREASRDFERAMRESDLIDVNGGNAAAREAEAREAEMKRHATPTPVRPRMPVTRPQTAPSRQPQTAPYFGKRDVRSVHGEVRRAKEQQLQEDEYGAGPTEMYPEPSHPDSSDVAPNPPNPSRPSSATLGSKHVRFQGEDDSAGDGVDGTPASGHFEEKSADGSPPPPPIDVEEANVRATAATAAAAFHKQSTRASRLRYMAAPRHALLRGRTLRAPLRGLASDDQLTSSTAAPRVVVPQLRFEPRDWAAEATARVRLEDAASPRHASPRVVLVAPPGPRDTATSAELAAAATASPRVRHSFFPVRASPLVTSTHLGVAAGSHVADSGSNQLPADGVTNTSFDVAGSTSAVPAPGLASVPLSARHAYARPNATRPDAANGKPTPVALHRPADKGTRVAPAALSDPSSSASGSASRVDPVSVRALPVVTFNDLPSTQSRVFSRLAHHPEEARLFRQLWTPSSVITAANDAAGGADRK